MVCSSDVDFFESEPYAAHDCADQNIAGAGHAQFVPYGEMAQPPAAFYAYGREMPDVEIFVGECRCVEPVRKQQCHFVGYID